MQSNKEFDELVSRGLDLYERINNFRNPYGAFLRDSSSKGNFKIIRIVRYFEEWKEDIKEWANKNPKLVTRIQSRLLVLNDKVMGSEILERLSKQNLKSLNSKDSQELLEKVEVSLRDRLAILEGIELKFGDTKEVDVVRQVECLEIYRDSNKGLFVFINKDYKAPFHPKRTVRGDSSYWEKIYQIALKGSCPYNRELQKYFADRRNPLFNSYNYQVKPLLRQVGKILVVVEGVKIKILKEFPKMN